MLPHNNDVSCTSLVVGVIIDGLLHLSNIWVDHDTSDVFKKIEIIFNRYVNEYINHRRELDDKEREILELRQASNVTNRDNNMRRMIREKDLIHIEQNKIQTIAPVVTRYYKIVEIIMDRIERYLSNNRKKNEYIYHMIAQSVSYVIDMNRQPNMELIEQGVDMINRIILSVNMTYEDNESGGENYSQLADRLYQYVDTHILNLIQMVNDVVPYKTISLFVQCHAFVTVTLCRSGKKVRVILYK